MPNLDSWLTSHLPDLIAIRHDIHAHPELGLEEVRTARLVADRLRSWGIEVVEGVGGTGVVGTIRGRHPGQRSIGLRADMDALAILEQTGEAYASRTPGLMHACGHDGHTTMLLGAARYLASSPDFGGTLHLIFQPAEEGRRGALAMVRDGLFERFPCDAIYGLHNTPGMATGVLGTQAGPIMAAADLFTVTFSGVGGHGGVAPHRATDITYAQAHFVLGLQGIVGRNVAPLDTATLSIGYIQAGAIEAPNVIPTELTIRGTARCFTEEVRDLLDQRIRDLAQKTAEIWGCRSSAIYERGPSAVINREEQTTVALAAATEAVGPEQVRHSIKLSTGGEDFSDMMAVCPGAFMRIGNGVASDGSFVGLHTPVYDFNDAIIPDGIRYWVAVVHQELQSVGQA